jgi:hypothetical protein
MCYASPNQPFTTQLTPTGEQLYRRQFSPDDSRDYDMRGAFAKLGGNVPQGVHLTDQFKKPNHPTFSNQSQYSSPAQPGGNWFEMGPTTWGFMPSRTNIDQFGGDRLKDYFNRREPGNLLLSPPPDPNAPRF